jgi:hypothetical protein
MEKNQSTRDSQQRIQPKRDIANIATWISYSKRLSYLRNQAKPNIRKYIDEGRYITRKVLRSRKENL